MNNLTIIGNLTADCTSASTKTGKSVVNFTVAVNHRDANGEKTAEYINVAAWGKLGESLAPYLLKGKKVAVVGEASARGYKDKNGDIRANVEIRFANSIELLSKSEQQNNVPAESDIKKKFDALYKPEPTPVVTDDLPF